MNRTFLISSLIAASILFSAGISNAQAHKGISFQGVIKLPAGEYPTRAGVSVNARILSPSGCILREEQFDGVNISNGYINLAIGTGSVGGYNPGLSMKKVMDNSSTITGLTCLNADGSVNGGVTEFDPSATNGSRKLRVSLTIDSIPIVADFNMRSMAFAVNAESLDGKSKADFVQTSAVVTQGRLEDFLSAITSASGGSVKWNGTSFVSYDPVASDSIPGSSVVSLPYSKLTSVPSPLSEIGGLSCVNGKILKKVSGSWACGDESGVGVESDPTVQTFAKNAPGSGLEVSGSSLQVKMSDIRTNASGSWGVDITGNAATATTATNFSGSLAGDVTGTQGATKVEKIQGNIVASGAPSDGLLTWNSTLTRWEAVNPPICSSAQTLKWSSTTDSFSCQNVSITTSQVSDFPASSLWTESAGSVYRNTGYVGIGTTTPTGTLDVQGGTNATGAGVPITLVAQHAASGTSNLGGAVNITAGDSQALSGGKSGGAVNISGGTGAYVSGQHRFAKGGTATLKGGNGAASGGDGGSAILMGGSSTAAGAMGGSAVLMGGTAAEGIGGSVGLSAANGMSTLGTGNYSGGSVTISAGSGVGTGTGGDVSLNAGPSINPGGHGGKVLINAGTPNNGNGGDVVIKSGNGQGAGTISGSIKISHGTGQSGGAPGSVDFRVSDANSNTYFTSFGGSPILMGRAAGGNEAIPSAVGVDANLLYLGGGGYGATTTGMSTTVAAITMKSAQNFSDTAKGTYITFETSALNTANLQERMRIDSSGSVGIGTTTPGTTLDVAGGIRPGSTGVATGAACGAGNPEGTFAYDMTAHAPVYCNNAGVWTSMSEGATQTWSDVKASRALATNYTNSTGKPITISVILDANGLPQQRTSLVVNGTTVATITPSDYYSATAATVHYSTLSGVVPAGATYSLQISSGTPTIIGWLELR